KVVVDAGNGMGGHTVPTVLAGLPLTLVPMYFELDGTFPNHEANPLDPANLVDLQKRVREEDADLGLAFDGDADRCFVVDERGEPVPPSAVTALVAARELARHGGSGMIIHNLITSWSVPEVVPEHGGTPVRTRAGHSFINAARARAGAARAGAHSGHCDFPDCWNAGTGLPAPPALPRPTPAPRRVARGERRRPRPRRPPVGPARAKPPPPATPRAPASPRSGPPTRAGTASPSTNSTDSPSPARTGGSTSAPPTPNRSSACTPRHATPPPWPASATRPWPSSAAERPHAHRPGPGGEAVHAVARARATGGTLTRHIRIPAPVRTARPKGSPHAARSRPPGDPRLPGLPLRPRGAGLRADLHRSGLRSGVPGPRRHPRPARRRGPPPRVTAHPAHQRPAPPAYRSPADRRLPPPCSTKRCSTHRRASPRPTIAGCSAAPPRPVPGSAPRPGTPRRPACAT